MSCLSPQPYKGSRDNYPEDQRVINHVFSVWRKICEKYGYEEYSAPLLEALEIYTAKTGDEIVNEQTTYSFTDRGGRQVVIRPEMTPSISRMVAARRQELAYPARLYSIANFMRYERPQRGREREFWQLNFDIFGVDNIYADSEIIEMCYKIMREFGANSKMFTIRVNNRDIINYVMTEYLKLDVVQSQMMIKLFDRKEKMSQEDFEQQAREILGDNQDEGFGKIVKLLSAEKMSDLPSEILDHNIMHDVRQLFSRLASSGVDNAIFDINLMRGFDYYTGTVFEFFDNHPDNRRAMFGGGRYDGLVGLFGVEPVATVGIAPGLTTTLNFLESHKLLPDLRPATDIYMIVLGDSSVGAQKLAGKLREEGVNVAVDITERKLEKQIKSAVKSGVKYMLFVGEKELSEEMYTLKDIREESEQKLSFERIVTTVFDYRRKGKKISDLAQDDDIDDVVTM
jgi:histidyl-tRNA synthetase